MPPTDRSDSKAIKARLDRLRHAERLTQIVKAFQAMGNVVEATHR